MSDSESTTPAEFAKFLEVLRCPQCTGNLVREGQDALACPQCLLTFPIVNAIPRMLLPEMKAALLGSREASASDTKKSATAESFGYEWTHFSEMRPEWEQNFLDYMAPHGPDFFPGKRVLDAGCGAGRHSFYAAKYGADVWSIDLGPAVEVSHQNNAESGKVHVAQADLYHPPFAPESFDFIYSLGVLHHLPDPEAAFRALLKFLKPGAEVQIYLYWEPENQPLKRMLLKLVNACRRVTVRLPHAATHAVSYPMAVAAVVSFVWPYRILRSIPGLQNLAARIPMRQYADYPFRVCVNDQFDRLSAPIENRYTRAEVERWLVRAGLEDTNVTPYFGWLGSGRKPGKSPEPI